MELEGGTGWAAESGSERFGSHSRPAARPYKTLFFPSQLSAAPLPLQPCSPSAPPPSPPPACPPAGPALSAPAWAGRPPWSARRRCVLLGERRERGRGREEKKKPLPISPTARRPARWHGRLLPPIRSGRSVEPMFARAPAKEGAQCVGDQRGGQAGAREGERAPFFSSVAPPSLFFARRRGPQSALILPLSPPSLPTQAPLVGNPAPEFAAEAVFDQEFVPISLSQYKVRGGERERRERRREGRQKKALPPPVSARSRSLTSSSLHLSPTQSATRPSRRSSPRASSPASSSSCSGPTTPPSNSRRPGR